MDEAPGRRRLFDSAGNPLSERPDLDQTLLYDELLRRFIERELSKGEHGAAFSGLRRDERRPLVDRELTRLGVAAIGMFNREEVKILRDQLDKDLAYFCAERPVTSNLYGQSQSELLLGSFFFIHESRSRLTVDGTANGAQLAAVSGKPAPATGPTAFEFLHNTFGEFLAADFILRQVIENAETIRDLTEAVPRARPPAAPDLADPVLVRLPALHPAALKTQHPGPVPRVVLPSPPRRPASPCGTPVLTGRHHPHPAPHHPGRHRCPRPGRPRPLYNPQRADPNVIPL
jgi:hypothetical protein